MLNSERFLDRFKEIERYVRGVTCSTPRDGFAQMLTKAKESNPALKEYESHLRGFARLRNAIVHNPSDGGQVIAEPNDQAVRSIEQIAELVLKPPRVFPLFQRPVATLQVGDSIANAVRLMRKESFSQVPLYDGGQFVAVVTSNAVARWLGAQIEQPAASLTDVPLREVIPHNEDPENYLFLSIQATVFNVIESFEQYEQRGAMLDAILLTDEGGVSAAEDLRGIVTYWDLTIAHRQIQLPRRNL